MGSKTRTMKLKYFYSATPPKSGYLFFPCRQRLLQRLILDPSCTVGRIGHKASNNLVRGPAARNDLAVVGCRLHAATPAVALGVYHAIFNRECFHC